MTKTKIKLNYNEHQLILQYRNKRVKLSGKNKKIIKPNLKQISLITKIKDWNCNRYKNDSKKLRNKKKN